MRSKIKPELDVLSQNVLFEKINHICSLVNTVIGFEELLQVSLKETMSLLGAKRGSIFILDDNGEDLILRASEGMKNEETKRMVKRLGEGIVGQVAQLKKPIVVEDIAQDDRFNNFNSRKSYYTPSFICAPLLLKDKLIGVINITDKKSGLHFTTDEMTLLDFLSSQIALNFRRIGLYQKFRKIVQETKNLKDRLGQSDQEAEHLKKQIIIQEKLATIGKLAGGIAHEFNNPLDGVMRYTNLCIELTKDEDVIRGYLLEIKHGLNRMANIVKNLLACSRNEGLKKEKINFKQALEHSLGSLKTEIHYKNISVHKKIESDLPLIQDLGLERILINLLRNAVDSMKEGGQLTIKAAAQKNFLVVAISDTGSGIPVEIVDKIFEPFFTTKDMDKGCGLGLTIVGEVIKGYEGKIDVDSQVGQGTTFTVKLPITI